MIEYATTKYGELPREVWRNLNDVAVPMCDLLKTYSEFVWDRQQETAFTKTKGIFSRSPVLAFYDRRGLTDRVYVVGFGRSYINSTMAGCYFRHVLHRRQGTRSGSRLLHQLPGRGTPARYTMSHRDQQNQRNFGASREMSETAERQRAPVCQQCTKPE